MASQVAVGRKTKWAVLNFEVEVWRNFPKLLRNMQTPPSLFRDSIYIHGESSSKSSLLLCNSSNSKRHEKSYTLLFEFHLQSKNLIPCKWILTFCWPCISEYLSQYLTSLMHKICFTISFISCLYMFRAHVLIIRRSKLHYTTSGIITAIGGRLVHETATYRLWWYQRLSNLILTSWWWAHVLETCRGMK